MSHYNVDPDFSQSLIPTEREASMTVVMANKDSFHAGRSKGDWFNSATYGTGSNSGTDYLNECFTYKNRLFMPRLYL